MEPHSRDDRIGVVGIGTIGFQLAENLVRSGYPVTAYDVRDEVLEEFVDVGGDRAASCREIGEACRSVHVVVATDEQAKDVVYGDEGVFAGFEASDSDAEKLLVVHSTLVPDTVVDFAENAPDGVTVVDGPVSSTNGDNVREGKITIMFGGDEDIIGQYGSLWDVLAKETKHLGPVGAGLAMKLTNNAIHHAVEVATFEALEIGTEYGIDQDQFLDVIRSSSGNTYFAQNFEYFTRDVLLKQPDDPHWFAYNIRKNLMQALELSDTVDVDAPLIGHVSQAAPRWFKQLADDLEAETE